MVSDDIKDTPLVFVPGIFGSHLCYRDDGGGKRVFLKRRTALRLQTPDLSLPITWETNTNSRLSGKQQSPCPSICADEEAGCLEYMTLLGIKLASVYGPWLDKARATGRKVLVFAWDWRRQLDELSVAFESFLEKVVSDCNGTPVQVVAHSTGGLITLPILNKRASELFHSVVFAGCPFATGGLTFDWLANGTNIGLNYRLLSPKVLFTHGVLWNFCSFGTDFDNDAGWKLLGLEDHQKKGTKYYGLLDDDGENPLPDFNPIQPDDWVKHRLSIFREGYTATAEEMEHLKNALSAAKSYRELMISSSAQSKTQSDPVPVVVLRCSNRDTIQSKRRQTLGEDSWEWKDVRAPAGDGTVNSVCTIPPPGVKHRIVEAPEQIHMTLMEMPGFVDVVLTELHQERVDLSKTTSD